MRTSLSASLTAKVFGVLLSTCSLYTLAQEADLVNAEGLIIHRTLDANKEQKQSVVFANNRGRIQVIDGHAKGSVALLDFQSRKLFSIDEQVKETALSNFPQPRSEEIDQERIRYQALGAVETVAGMPAAKFALEVDGVKCATIYTSLELAAYADYVRYLQDYLGALPATENTKLSKAEREACDMAASEPLRSLAQFGAPVLVENSEGTVVFEVTQRIPAGLVPSNMFTLPDYPVKVLEAPAD